MTQWQVFGLITQMPFADKGGGVIVLLQVFRKGNFIAFDAVLRVVHNTRHSYTFGVASGQ